MRVLLLGSSFSAVLAGLVGRRMLAIENLSWSSWGMVQEGRRCCWGEPD